MTSDTSHAEARQPLARAPQASVPRPRTPARSRPAVLLVDDVPDNLLALAALLRRDDLEIVTASCGREALEALLDHDVAVAIVDVMMPEMDGFELAELIRGVQRTRHVPIIFVTAASKAEHRAFTGYQLGAIDFLFKPIDEHVLRAKVDVLVALERQRRELQASLRLAEQARAETKVLLHLAQATSHCVAPDDLFAPALDAVVTLLAAERSAILLLDAGGAMRFAACRGLSAGYRAAVEGHSPWVIGAEDPQPLLFGDVETAPAMAPYRPVFAAEGIRAIAFVPILDAGRRLLGKFMLYWREARTFSPHECELAMAVAAQVGQALTKARLRANERETQQKLRVALAAGRMGVWEWSIPDGRVTWSPELERIHGLEPGTFAGTFEAYQQDIHPDDRERVFATIQQTIAAGCHHQVEYRIVRPDGQVRWVAGHGDVVARDAGAPVTVMGVCQDVTAQKQLEGEREAAAAELARTLRENEVFAGVLAHDLRNPLGAMMTAARAALLGTGGHGDVAEAANLIVSSGTRMRRLIDQLLDFTRARVGGGIGIEVRPADLAGVCDQAVAELAVVNPAWCIEVAARGDLRGTWDSDRLLQMLSNLLANAGQHGAAGGVIRLDVDGTEPDHVALAVHNLGCIRKELLPALFVPFRGAGERDSQRLGLGLFITKDIVDGHGGTIDVASTERDGTTFRIRLPRHARSRAAAASRRDGR